MANVLKAPHAPSRLRRAQPAIIEPLAWLAAATATLLVAVTSTHNRTGGAVLALGVLMCMLGIRVFLKHGGPRITALGLFALSSSVVVGVGAIQEVLSPQNRTAGIYLQVAVYFSFVAQCLVCYIAWKPCSSNPAIGPLIEARTADILKWFSCAALTSLTAYKLFANAQGQVIEASAFAIIVLISIGALASEGRPVRILDILLLVGGLGLYAQIYQGGSGRLRLVALAFTIAMIWATTHPTRFFKWYLLAAAPFAVVALALQRLSLQESLRTGASHGRTGLESMTEPILVFAQIIQAQAERGWPLAGGRTLFTLPASLIPGDLGPGALEPLGYELVKITDPGRYGTGYSVAATTFGEWWYNFSAYSLVLVVPFLVLALSVLDKAFTRSINGLTRRGGTLWFAIVAMACGSIADLAWMGLHIYGARMLWRIPATLAVLIVVTLLAGGRRGPSVTTIRTDARPGVAESAALARDAPVGH